MSLNKIFIINFQDCHTCVQHVLVISIPFSIPSLPPPQNPSPYLPYNISPSKLYVPSPWLSLVSAVLMCMEVGILWNMDKEGFFFYL